MRNRFAKKCCWCGVRVEAMEGKCWNYNGRWYVGCQACIDAKFDSDDKEEEK